MFDKAKNEKLMAYLGKIEHLPTLPVIVTQILEKTSNPEFDMNSVVDLILMDQVLTAKMIRLVNSAYWGLGRPIESLRQAIICLGIRNVRNVVFTTSLMQVVPGSQKSKWIKSFWEHSFACALICRLVAQRVVYKDLERAYLAGLLHDIGEIILIQNFPDEFEKVVKVAEKKQWDFYEAEKEVMAITHVDFGPWLLDQWKLCSEIAHVVARHHDVQSAVIEPGLVAIVRIADLYSRSKGLSLGNFEGIEIALEKEPAWSIIRAEFPQAKKIEPEVQLEYLDMQLDTVKQFIQMIYD